MARFLLLVACAGTPGKDTPDPDSGSVPAGSLADASLTIEGGPSYSAGSAVALARDADGTMRAVVGGPFAGITCAVALPREGRVSMEGAPDCWSAESTRDNAGIALAAGDWDGDGFADLLVGAITQEDIGPTSGKVYVVPGPLEGGGALGAVAVALRGETKGDYAGWAVAVVPDTNGDGRAELFVGAPGSERGGLGGGAAYLLTDPPVDGTLLQSETVFVGRGPATAAPPHGAPSEGDGVGSVLGDAGDLDGDGLSELLLGANGHETGGADAGAVAVWMGPAPTGVLAFDDADRLWVGAAALTYAGDAAIGAADLTGDGLPDLAVVDQVGPGVVRIVASPPPPSGPLPDATWATVRGEADGDQAGASIAAADLDGDGADDLVVGAYGNDATGDTAGAVYVVRGPFLAGDHDARDGAVWRGVAANDWAGRVVAAGEGVVVVGAPYAASGAPFGGAAYVLDGR